MQLKLVFVFACVIAYSSLAVYAILPNVAIWGAYQAITAAQAGAIAAGVGAIPAGSFYFLTLLNALNKKKKEKRQPEVPPPPFGFNNNDGNMIIDTECDLLPQGQMYFNPKQGETQNCRIFLFIDSHTNRACSWTQTGVEDQEYILPIPYSNKTLTLFKTALYSKQPVTSVKPGGGFQYSNLDSLCVRPYMVKTTGIQFLTKNPILHVLNDCAVYREIYNTQILPGCRAFFPTPPPA